MIQFMMYVYTYFTVNTLYLFFLWLKKKEKYVFWNKLLNET